MIYIVTAFILYYVSTITFGFVETYYDYKEVENLHDKTIKKIVQRRR